MIDDSRILILGGNGQLGLALQSQYPNASVTDVDELDITDKKSVHSYDWSNIDIVINAAAYTNVDGAETSEGRRSAWDVNAKAVEILTHTARSQDFIFVHISTDYVFDGEQKEHDEYEPFSPLSVYGASKAAGDLLVSQLEKHYILRTSWVIGDGKNFVRSIMGLGNKGVEPAVVADQFGRLTFTSELVRAIDHLLSNKVPFGAYNVTNDGAVSSWADIAREVYSCMGLKLKVSDTTADEYFEGKVAATRPVNSSLKLDKVQSTGFTSTDWKEDLKKYIDKQSQFSNLDAGQGRNEE